MNPEFIEALYTRRDHAQMDEQSRAQAFLRFDNATKLLDMHWRTHNKSQQP